jgi:hypothetical protein
VSCSAEPDAAHEGGVRPSSERGGVFSTLLLRRLLLCDFRGRKGVISHCKTKIND